MMENRINDIFIFLFDRDLKKLEAEISHYQYEADLWRVEKNITNPGGNLALHLCGNLQYYIGTVLGHTGYTRNRPHEFAARGIPKDELIAEIRQTREVVISTLEKLSTETFDGNYPEDVLGYPMTTKFFISHLFGHFGYHLGQINYHRRLLGH